MVGVYLWSSNPSFKTTSLTLYILIALCLLSSHYSVFSITHVQPWHMKREMLSVILTQILMHVAALIGVVFALLQWILISRVSVFVANHTDVNNGYWKAWYEIQNRRMVFRLMNCAEIQHANYALGTSSLVTIFKITIWFSHGTRLPASQHLVSFDVLSSWVYLMQ